MRRRYLSIAVLALLFAACGGATAERTVDGAAAILAAAPDEAAAAGSARFTMEMAVSGVPDGDVTMSGEGATVFDEQRMRMTMDLRGMVPGADGTLEMLLDGTILYQRSELFASMLPQGVTWVRLDLDQLSEQTGVDVGALAASGQQTDFTAYLETLRGVSEGVEEVGSEEVRGVPTTHYRATVDEEKALEQVPDEARTQLEAMLGGSGNPTSYPVDVWIDDDGLPRRFALEMDVDLPEADGPVTQTLSMELFDYGVEVDVEPPPAEETIDLQELMGSLPSGAPTG